MLTRWQKFEKNATKFLEDINNNNNIKVIYRGNSNSKTIDIEILKNNLLLLNIEVKMPKSQIGQFVIIDNQEETGFKISPRLHENNIPRTEKILEFINLDYLKYKNTSISGQEVNCSEEIKNDAIKEYLKLKNISYIISCDKNSNFKIIHKDNFFNFFKVDKCIIRKKASGSQHISSSVFGEVRKYLKNEFECQIIQKKPKTEVVFKKDYSSILENKVNRYFYVNNKKYYLSKNQNSYFVKKTSDTANPTVIFILKFLDNNIDDNRKVFEEDINK